MSKDSELALLGGQPLREQPFHVEPMVGTREEELVLAAIRECNFSRYIGSPNPSLEQQLRQTSAEGVKLEDYWHFLGGPNVREFAAAFATKTGAPFAIPVNSATSGISVALAASRVSAGDEVIVPAISYTASATAILMFNSIPVFADVDPLTFCLNPDAVEAAITPRTKAILVVHLVGNLANMEALGKIAKKHGLVIIEDAAQAPGAKWKGKYAGTIGDAGVFSFQQSKNIMTGEGGMIVTHNVEIARRARLIINHGEGVMSSEASAHDLADIVGFNFRLPELCAAIGIAQLERMDEVNDWRSRNADTLRNGLANIPGIDLPPSQRAETNNEIFDIPHLFVALHNTETMGIDRDLFILALRAEGIPVGTGYARCMYENPLFLKKIAFGEEGSPWSDKAYNADREYVPGLCPIAESLLYKKFLWFYHIAYSSTEEDMDDIVGAVRKVVDNRQALLKAKGRLSAELGAYSQGRIGVDPKQLKTG